MANKHHDEKTGKFINNSLVRGFRLADPVLPTLPDAPSAPAATEAPKPESTKR